MTSIRHNPVRTPEQQSTPDDAYLDAAREAILAVGWSRTTLTDIARRAGVSRMTLYRRWPDTQTLLADLMTREWGQVVEMTGVEMTGIEMTGVEQDGGHDGTLEQVTSGIVATVQALRANALLRRIVDVDPEVLLPYLLDRRGRSQELVAETLAALISHGQQDGTVRAGDPAVLARSLLLACHGFTLSAHTMADGDSRDADVTHLDAELGELVRRYLQA